ncbi:MAG: hypothetical protein LBP36_04400 [Oscillospiraceae bacterium]|jgi:DNA-directed RNA polymerase specialized sigma subunit|nr:hypothetical protein [Oscillospiraceae bacterium]
MCSKNVSFNDFTESLVGLKRFECDFDEDYSYDWKRLLNSLENIINGELTEKQKICLNLYYNRDVNMTEISKSMGVNISVVSRHIKKAKNRIKKVMLYYLPDLREKSRIE